MSLVKNLKVLIVDDNAEVRFCLRVQLCGGGHTVVAETEDLAGTLEAYQKHRPDLVMLDLSLDSVDGLVVLTAIKEKDPNARIIIFSANQLKQIRAAALQAGAIEFLNKPVDMGQLESVLATL